MDNVDRSLVESDKYQ